MISLLRRVVVGASPYIEEEEVPRISKIGGIYGAAYIVIAASLAESGYCGLDSMRSPFLK